MKWEGEAADLTVVEETAWEKQDWKPCSGSTRDWRCGKVVLSGVSSSDKAAGLISYS